MIFISWIIFSVVAGVIAAHKGRSGLGFFYTLALDLTKEANAL
jgi:uncharacterized membrane protein YeaQ/YmgE (transglycosylase-associated protein family)